MKLRTSVVWMAMSLAVATPAHAHEVAKGPNGGPMVDVKGHHVELVSGSDKITVFLTDADERPVASTGSEARAVVQSAGKVETLTLRPEPPNQLTAARSGPLPSGSKVVVTGKLGDGVEISARFVVP